MKNNQKGITLIALIITIIVMLILVAVTINVALNGGLFTKAKTATLATEISQIKEQLVIKKATQIADAEQNGQAVPTSYNLTLNDLDLPETLVTKYGSKLIIGTDGKLYYNEEEVTAVEKANLEALEVTKYEEQAAAEIEYYNYCYKEKGDWYEKLYSVDYEKRQVKEYSGDKDQILTPNGSGSPEGLIITKNATINITMDNQEQTITNCTAIYYSEMLLYFIKDTKLYVYSMEDNGDIVFFSTDFYVFNLVSDFDATRLIEEQE